VLLWVGAFFSFLVRSVAVRQEIKQKYQAKSEGNLCRRFNCVRQSLAVAKRTESIPSLPANTYFTELADLTGCVHISVFLASYYELYMPVLDLFVVHKQ
jgi:hypothetical protein